MSKYIHLLIENDRDFNYIIDELNFHNRLWDEALEMRMKITDGGFLTWLWDSLFVHKYKKAEKVCDIEREISDSLLHDLRQEVNKSNALLSLLQKEIAELMEKGVEKEIADFWKVLETRKEV